MSEVSPRKCPWLKILLGGVALGVLVLAGLAWGMRVTDARPFCSSCHIMEQAARTHKLSPCQAGLQRMSRSDGVAVEVAL